jgi:unsaturated chondroitin disaccharide hydrolase
MLKDRPMNQPSSTRVALERAFSHAQQQVEKVLQKYPTDYYPMYTVNGEFGHDRKRWTHWCDGFFPGMMFVFASRTGQSKWLDNAVAYSHPLEDRQFDRTVHDLGFLFFSTHLRWLELGGPPKKIDPLLIQAGKTMAMRFMERGQYLRSFVEPASLFVDIMMNVGTIFYAGKLTNDSHLLDIANRHCLTSRRVLVRGDGSTAHEAMFDLESGEVLRQSTHQGYRGDSCWSRGLAWSLYGFTRSYGQSARGEYLETACANADYYIATTPENGVPPWDYDAPLEGPLSRNQVDTSTAAIAASGLLNLAKAVPNSTKAQSYRNFALRSLESLSNEYLGQNRANFEGVLDGGVYHIHKKLGVHEAVLFGDYFFVEALDKGLSALDEQSVGDDIKPYPEDSLPDWARVWNDGPTEEELPAPEEEAAS